VIAAGVLVDARRAPNSPVTNTAVSPSRPRCSISRNSATAAVEHRQVTVLQRREVAFVRVPADRELHGDESERRPRSAAGPGAATDRRCCGEVVADACPAPCWRSKGGARARRGDDGQRLLGEAVQAARTSLLSPPPKVSTRPPAPGVRLRRRREALGQRQAADAEVFRVGVARRRSVVRDAEIAGLRRRGWTPTAASRAGPASRGSATAAEPGRAGTAAAIARRQGTARPGRGRRGCAVTERTTANLSAHDARRGRCRRIARPSSSSRRRTRRGRRPGVGLGRTGRGWLAPPPRLRDGAASLRLLGAACASHRRKSRQCQPKSGERAGLEETRHP